MSVRLLCVYASSLVVLVGAAARGPDALPKEIVFAVRASMGPHWYENFGTYSNEPERPAYSRGGRLCVLDTGNGAVRDLVNDPEGGVRDPQVHYDGRRILFSYRKGGTPAYHLYEVNTDGTGLRKLTDGPDDDIEPCYLPDGGIVFASSRCRRFVNCWFTRVATLYRCDGDGANVRALSASIEHDNTPWVLPDGRIIYMRWEYVDRSQVHFHHLWTMNPDGTNQTVYYGNQMPGTVMLGAKPIPGSRGVVAAFSPDHGLPEHAGYVTVVDPTLGPDEPSSARRISRTPWFRDPYPLRDGRYLVATGRRIVAMEEDGSVSEVYRLRDDPLTLELHEPRPIEPRPRERVIPSHVDLSKASGACVLADVASGRNMAGVRPGEITQLLVLEQLPKPVNFSGGMEPLSMWGTFTLARILGTVPVEADGSAFFELPAMRPVFFVALDARGLAVKRMQSFTSVQPGETLGCVGCHEPRTTTAQSRPQLLALRRPPSRLRPVEGVPDVPDFPRDIQPILDRRCLPCHGTEVAQGGVVLSGDRTPLYSVSYETITLRRLVADGRNEPRGNRPPRTIGTSASRLLKLADGSHHGALATQSEMAVLRGWIETSATYPGTYAALGCGMAWVPLPIEQMRRRCGPCHNRPRPEHRSPAESLIFGWASAANPGMLCNLSRPELSALVRAPLSRDVGGTGACREAVLSGVQDPLYRGILDAIRSAGAWLEREKRFDMPGFRPNQHYVREMQRFGILPKDLAPLARVDPYATDRKYWDSFAVK